MTGPIYLALVLHNHQPIGQFNHVAEHSTHVSYLPMIEALERFPRIKVAMHYSGSLLGWLAQHNSNLIERLRALVGRGQIEMLSGGYYEPPLATIPDEDKIGQIHKLSESLQTLFNSKASGMWLAERLWEPHLARPIAEANMRYVILDDVHFESVGFDREKDLFGYFITEEAGHRLAIFPGLTRLRYTIPWEPVENLLDWLREKADLPRSPQLNQPRLALMADDGGKFGTWPGTYEHCWGDSKYIDELFTLLDMNADWVRTITPGEFMNRFRPLGRAYLPAMSYMEMGTWSLLPEDSYRLDELRKRFQRERRPDVVRFLHGGQWRNFMIKYHEINHLHKRMMMISSKVHTMRRGRKRERALDLLWAAQGIDPYWHGLFGGIYLFNIRTANYANLLAAEDVAESEELTISLVQQDFDCDGYDDILFSSQTLNAIWSPNMGGALVELDYRPAHYNLLNVVNRHPEGYHQTLRNAVAKGNIITPQTAPEHEPSNGVRVKEPGLEKHLIYDWHRRASYIDHFLAHSTRLPEFYSAKYAEQGDFVGQPYQVLETSQTDTSAHVVLARESIVWIGDKDRKVRVRKAFTLHYDDPTLYVKYALSSLSDTRLDLRFGVETVIGFDGGQDPRYTALAINDSGVRLPLNAISEFEAVDNYATDSNLRNLTLTTRLSKPAFLWQFPLEAISLSEAGFERGYQGTVFLQFWQLSLAPQEQWEVSIAQTVQQTATRP
jgi:4-alpha-glucanotransferase